MRRRVQAVAKVRQCVWKARCGVIVQCGGGAAGSATAATVVGGQVRAAWYRTSQMVCVSSVRGVSQTCGERRRLACVVCVTTTFCSNESI